MTAQHIHVFIWSGDYWACDCGYFPSAEIIEGLENDTDWRSKYDALNQLANQLEQQLAEMRGVIRDHEDIHADHRRLVRTLDGLLNGDGAAEQAVLCDIVAQVADKRWRLVPTPPPKTQGKCENCDTPTMPDDKQCVVCGADLGTARAPAAERETEVCPMCIGDKVVLDEPCDECEGTGRVAAQPAAEPSDAETLARQFHETYERLAPNFGYETRPETREFDPTTPNGSLMRAVCAELIRNGAHELYGKPAAEREGYSDLSELKKDAAYAMRNLRPNLPMIVLSILERIALLGGNRE